MKKLTYIISISMVLLITTIGNATTFNFVSSSYSVYGFVQEDGLFDTNYYNDSATGYYGIASGGLSYYDQFGYYFECSSSASFMSATAWVETGAHVAYFAGARFSTVFKPISIGGITHINFFGSLPDMHAYYDAEITDLTTNEEIFFINNFDANLPISFSFSGWDLSHEYCLSMGGYLGDNAVGTDGRMDLSSDLSFANVPEPATMLLLGLGFMGLAGVRRKFKK